MNDARLLNVSAIKAHALRVSAERRAGKFERVGESFLEQVEADVDTVVRQLANACPLPDGFRPVATDNVCFVTQHMDEKLAFAMSDVVARIIQRRVHRHPSVGKTLQG